MLFHAHLSKMTMRSWIGGFVLSVLLVCFVPAIAAADFSTGFESADGYSAGSLNGQDGWMVDSGQAEVTTSLANSGSQSARVAADGSVSRQVTVSGDVAWVDTYMMATPATNPGVPGSPRSAALFVSDSGVQALDGNGAGGGSWVNTGVNVSAGSWFRVTIRLDFTSQTWDVWINGAFAEGSLGFHSNSITSLQGMTVKANSQGDTYMDDVAVAAALDDFVDSDNDGIMDSVETDNPPDYGNTRPNRYLSDSDGDGLSDGYEDANRNGVHDLLETECLNRDSDGDQYADGLEVLVLGSDPLNASDPGGFTDNDGDELNDNTVGSVADPNSSSADSDGDLIKDGYEAMMLGVVAVSNASQKPPLGDINDDGQMNNTDALIIQSMFLGLTPYAQFSSSNADVNRDAAISNVDALVVHAAFLGLSSFSSLPL